MNVSIAGAPLLVSDVLLGDVDGFVANRTDAPLLPVLVLVPAMLDDVELVVMDAIPVGIPVNDRRGAADGERR